MLLHTIKVYPSKINLPKKKQLAWKIAEIASDNSKLNNILKWSPQVSLAEGLSITYGWIESQLRMGGRLDS